MHHDCTPIYSDSMSRYEMSKLTSGVHAYYIYIISYVSIDGPLLKSSQQHIRHVSPFLSPPPAAGPSRSGCGPVPGVRGQALRGHADRQPSHRREDPRGKTHGQ